MVVAGALASARAEAQPCRCAEFYGSTIWPRVFTRPPTDTTIVAAVSDAAGYTYELKEKASGAPVPLDVIRVLPVTKGCPWSDRVFLRLRSPLAPNREYTFIPVPTRDSRDVNIGGLNFTTDAGPQAPPAHEVTLSLFAQEVAGGARLLQLFALSAAEAPAFVRAVGKEATVVIELGRAVFPNPPSQPVGVPLGTVACAEAEIVDVTGRTVKTERLCHGLAP